MYKKIIIGALSTLASFGAMSKGLEITKFKNWEEVLTIAKEQDKLILVDCYTTWCGPCKMMTSKVFPQDIVGDYANDKFVTVKIQFDSTAKDDEYVKANYALARSFEKQYGIAAYPSFMVFNAKGEPVHRFVGAYEAEDFVNILSKATQPEYQFYTQLKQYEADSNNLEVIKRMSTTAAEAYDMKTLERVNNQWIKKEGVAIFNNKEAVSTLIGGLRENKGSIFDFLYKNIAQIKDVSTKKDVNNKLASIILQNEHMTELAMSEKPNWDKTEKALKAKYKNINWDETIASAKVALSSYKKDTKQLLADMKSLYAKNFTLPEQMVNSIAWSQFESNDNKAELKELASYIAKQAEASQDSAFIDTYANLLYKIGDTDKAIKQMERALELADENSQGAFQETLDKMNGGLPTWE